LDRIKEAEVDALFTHFLKECDLEGYDVAGDYWKCIDEIKVNEPGYQSGGHTTQEFFREVKKNSILKERFLGISPASIKKMSNKIMEVIGCMTPEKYSALFEQHRKMKITDEEFDEFIVLFFRMCSPTPKYLSNVWYNVVKIKKEMIRKTMIDIDIIKE